MIAQGRLPRGGRSSRNPFLFTESVPPLFKSMPLPLLTHHAADDRVRTLGMVTVLPFRLTLPVTITSVTVEAKATFLSRSHRMKTFVLPAGGV